MNTEFTTSADILAQVDLALQNLVQLEITARTAVLTQQGRHIAHITDEANEVTDKATEIRNALETLRGIANGSVLI
jgi:phage gp36-like protein